MKISKFHFWIILGIAISVSGCYTNETIDTEIKQVELSQDPLDQYIQQNFIDKYGIAVRYRYVDRLVEQNRRVAPPKLEVVKPMLDFIEKYWIQPYVSVANGEDFFKNHVPAEVVLIGSTMYNFDGTVTLGTADAGARITLTEVNFIDTTNTSWIFRQLGTIYHEFAHIIHQRYNLPANFQRVSPTGYTSLGSWFNLTDEEALQRGFVSPYGTSTFNEDYAEIVSKALFDPLFFEKYINDEENCADDACQERNEGKALIRQKFNMILAHYEQNTGVDLMEVRELIQSRY
ncbi:MAG: substrate import-associated zinc metallohydrolase lipoprotein [Candidatus Cyclobacteriaceae bacterium M3_2C_046]